MLENPDRPSLRAAPMAPREAPRPEKPQRLLMIGGWTEIFQHAKDCGFHLTVAQERARITGKDLAIVDELVTAAMDDPLLVDLFSLVHETRPFAAVLSFQELGLLTAAHIGDRLGIAANPLDPVLLTRDKIRMRRHLRDRGAPSIPFVVADSRDAVLALARDQGWPLIIKPSRGSGSSQIHRIDSADDIDAALAAIAAAHPDDGAVAEKLVTGVEISLEGMSWNGRHVIFGATDKIITGPPRFVEIGHSMPSALPRAILDAAKQVTVEFLTLIGHRFGPTHTELIITEDGPRIIEAHTRTGGDHIWDMVEEVYGVDMFEVTLRAFAGQEPDLRERSAKGGVAIRYLVLPPGVVTGISGVETLSTAEDIISSDISVKIGQRVKPFSSSDDRYGYVLARGATAAAAAQTIEQAMKRVTITVREAPP